MAKQEQDLYNYKGIYERVKERLQASSISKVNKDLILEFERKCTIVENLEFATRIKYIDSLITISNKWVKKDFDKLTKQDYENIIIGIEEGKTPLGKLYSEDTKAKFKVILKKFGRWLTFRDKAFNRKDYPENVEWINTYIKKKNQKKIAASDILTEEEVSRIIEAATNIQHKAFLSVLYETGARISEVGNLKIKNLTRKEYEAKGKKNSVYEIDLNGKTGQRTVIAIMSAPYIDAWLQHHPVPKADSPLWVVEISHKSKDRNRGEKLGYASFTKTIKRLTARAGINKRVYNHLFRHSRVSHLLANKIIGEQQAKAYFGWTLDSSQLSTYSHVVSADANNALLESQGILDRTNGIKKLKKCISCHKVLLEDKPICPFCNKLSSMDAVEALDNKNARIMDFINLIMEDEVIKERTKELSKQPKSIELLQKIKEVVGN
ncbi:MAG TPA: tyrosine-type recombinase/integrase [Candidatus Nanoarchaeia archaeon]|nr:tyrosine-type recombinase/integrase [Candidatus Nanoarchaeia archaeon]